MTLCLLYTIVKYRRLLGNMMMNLHIADGSRECNFVGDPLENSLQKTTSVIRFGGPSPTPGARFSENGKNLNGTTIPSSKVESSQCRENSFWFESAPKQTSLFCWRLNVREIKKVSSLLKCLP